VSEKTSVPLRARDELRRLYAAAAELLAADRCVCTDAEDASDATCCHFGILGREPYVTALEMAEVARAVAARGGFPRSPREGRKRLPMAEANKTCPLLSSSGRCTIYDARPLGCRTFFCHGNEAPGAGRKRKEFLAMSRRIADLSAAEFPRSDGPRPFLRALAELRRSG
jgi:uncharacterized protein